MTKTKFKYFTIFQYKAEQEYLRDMHSAGWKLTGISFPGFYHFEGCTPEDVVYQLDYNKNGTAHKREYVQIFTDCGWEYLFDFVGYSYFRKPTSQMKNSEEAFYDDEFSPGMMKRVLSGRIKYVCVLFLALAICAFLLFGVIHPFLPASSQYQLHTSPGQYSIGAEYLNEPIQHEMELKAGEELEVTLQLIKGEVHLLIYLDDENPICENTASSFSSFTLPIHQDGTYTIILSGEDAEGSFHFQSEGVPR